MKIYKIDTNIVETESKIDLKKITFVGENNKITIGKNAKIDSILKIEGKNSEIRIGDNSIVSKSNISCISSFSLLSIGQNCEILSAEILLGMSGNIMIGNNCFMNYGVHIRNDPYITRRRVDIIIGDDCMIAGGTFIMSSDGHPIYVHKYKFLRFFFRRFRKLRLLNPEKDIIIKNKVWVGINSMIIGGAFMPKGCVFGARSFVKTKLPKENCIYVNSKLVRKNITWERYTKDENIQQGEKGYYTFVNS